MTEIVIQPPKSQNSIRSIPLLQGVINDLFVWKSVQDADRAAMRENYNESGFIVTNQNGGYIEPRTFRDYYIQILNAANLRNFTFHALRHTFASRAMEQGMDSKTLSIILGHYSVSFTLDTYAHVLNEHKYKEMNLMEDLFAPQKQSELSYSYPVIITSQNYGTFCFSIPDFPELSFVGDNFADGIQHIKENLSEIVLTRPFLPQPTVLSDIVLNNTQTLIQIPV